MASTSKDITEHIAGDLLSRAHSPSTAEKIFVEKVKQRPLLLQPNPTVKTGSGGGGGGTDERSQRRLARLRKKEYFLRKQKPRPLSAKEKRSLGVYEIPKPEQKYEIYLQMHRLWVEYMQDILGLTTGVRQQAHQHPSTTTVTVAGHGSLLATADFHGALVQVVRSKAVGRVGTKGIVVRDTKFTFVVITERNELKTIPKDNCTFGFEIPFPLPSTDGDGEQQTAAAKTTTREPLKFELRGEHFQYRPADRANKKFKWQSLENI